MFKAFLLLAILMTSFATRAEDGGSPYLPNKDTWNQIWPEHVLITGLTLPTLAIMKWGIPHPTTPRWTGGILLDDLARDALRMDLPSGRKTAALTSDVFLISNLLAPVGISIAKGDHWISFMGYVEAATLAQFFVTATKRFVARKRPDDDNYESFISGHAAGAFLGAGAICGMGLPKNWTRSKVWRWATCGVALGAATTVSALRIVADKHYLSDVALGAGVGLFFGWFYSQWTFRDSAVRPVAQVTRRTVHAGVQFDLP